MPADEVDDRDEDQDDETTATIRVTRRVHVILGLVIAVLGAMAVAQEPHRAGVPRSERRAGTRLPSRPSDDLPDRSSVSRCPRSGYSGPKARSGEAPTLSLSPRRMGRAFLVWLALVVCAFLIEPLGFLLAGEVLVLLVIVVVERIRSIPLIITLLLLPPAMYFLFDTLLEVQLPGGTLWY